jgi:hypothetical protein
VRRRAAWAAMLLLGLSTPADAHRLAPSYLEIREHRDGAVDVLWRTPLLRAAGSDLRPVLPAGCRPEGQTHTREDPAARTVRLRLACGEGGLAGARVGASGLEASGTDVLVHVARADGSAIHLLLSPARPSAPIPDRAGARGVLLRYGGLGVTHLLGGLDHALFVTGLVLLVPGRRRLLAAVTAFTVGHSATLALTTLGVLRIPSDAAELAIAASLVLLARALVAPARAGAPLLARRPWLASGAFGLVHGLGFAGALTEIGFPPGELPLALLAFNVGIEVGQLALVGVLLAVGLLLAPVATRAGRAATELPATAIGALGVFYLIERAAFLAAAP